MRKLNYRFFCGVLEPFCVYALGRNGKKTQSSPCRTSPSVFVNDENFLCRKQAFSCVLTGLDFVFFTLPGLKPRSSVLCPYRADLTIRKLYIRSRHETRLSSGRGKSGVFTVNGPSQFPLRSGSLNNYLFLTTKGTKYTKYIIK